MQCWLDERIGFWSAELEITISGMMNSHLCDYQCHTFKYVLGLERNFIKSCQMKLDCVLIIRYKLKSMKESTCKTELQINKKIVNQNKSIITIGQAKMGSDFFAHSKY